MGSTEETEEKYRNPEIGEIIEGKTFRINAFIPPEGELFTIDLITNLVLDLYRLIAIRVTGRIEDNTLTGSYRTGLVWSDEVTFFESSYELKRAERISIEILILNQDFLIACNGFHCGKFPHHFSYKKIRILEIRGDLEDIRVDRRIATEYPQRPLESSHFGRIQKLNIGLAETLKNKRTSSRDGEGFPLPYIATFDRGLFSNCRSIFVVGRVLPGGSDFTVTLQTGSYYWPESCVCYAVKFKFYDEAVDTAAPFKTSMNEIVKVRRGDIVKLHILHDIGGFSGFINEQVCDFRAFECNPAEINTIIVNGDITLLDIIIES